MSSKQRTPANGLTYAATTGAKWPLFEWRKEWGKYVTAITDPGQRLAMIEAITNYGLEEAAPEPPTLNPANLDYFNNQVRPRLDEQHRKLKPIIERYGNGR